MPIRKDIPQVRELMSAVKSCFNHDLESRSDFYSLSFEIEKITGEHLGENTLRRLWGKMKGYDTIYIRTLDVLSKYVGCKHYSDFCLKISGKRESVMVESVTFKVEDLCPGDRFRLGWCPDRVCIIEFQGGKTFKAIDCKNATLQNGDSFECSMMVKDFPLFVENLVHGGEMCNGYVMGLVSGLTILEKL